MSPEQAAGQNAALTPASDVYSLGATLYHLLVGKVPFAGGDTYAILERAIRGLFPRPREVEPSVPAALEAVCLKAMALRPEERYGSARELADDVERWLADEPLSAYRDTIFTLATDGTYTSLSPSFETLYGWSRDEWLGKPFALMIHPEDLPSALSLFQRALHGETPPVFQVRILTKSRQYVTVEVMCILQVVQGEVVGVLGITRPGN